MILSRTFTDLPSFTIGLSILQLGFHSLLFFKEFWINLQDVLIEVSWFESSHCNIEVGLNDRGYVTLIHTKVERLDVVVVGEDPVNFSFNQDVWNDSGQVICRDLLI